MNEEEYEEKFETSLMIMTLVDRINTDCKRNKLLWNPVKTALIAYLDYLTEILDNN